MYSITDAVESLDPYLESFSQPLATFEIMDASNDALFAHSNDTRIKTKYAEQQFFLCFGQDASNVTLQSDIDHVAIWGQNGLLVNGTKDPQREFLLAHTAEHQVCIDFGTQNQDARARIALLPECNDTFFITHHTGCTQWGLGDVTQMNPYIFMNTSQKRQGFNTTSPRAPFHFYTTHDNTSASTSSFLFDAPHNEFSIRSRESSNIALHFQHHPQTTNTISSTTYDDTSSGLSIWNNRNESMCITKNAVRVLADELFAAHDFVVGAHIYTPHVTTSNATVSDMFYASLAQIDNLQAHEVRASNVNVTTQLSAENISVCNNLDILQDAHFNIYGDMEFNGNVSFNTSNLVFHYPLRVESSLFVQESAEIEKDLTVHGPMVLENTCTLHDRFVIPDVWDVRSNQVLLYQPLRLHHELEAHRLCTFRDHVTFSNDVTLDKDVIQRQGRNTTLANLHVNDQATLEKLTVLHGLDIKGPFSIKELAVFEDGIRVKNQDATLDTLDVLGKTHFADIVTAAENVYLEKNAEVRKKTTTNELCVQSNSELQGNLVVLNKTDLHRDVHMHQNVVIDKDLRVEGQLRLGTVIDQQYCNFNDSTTTPSDPISSSFTVNGSIESESGSFVADEKGFQGPSTSLARGLFLYTIETSGAHTIYHYDENVQLLKTHTIPDMTWMAYGNGLLYVTFANGEISSIHPHNFQEYRRISTPFSSLASVITDDQSHLLLGQDGLRKYHAFSLQNVIDKTLSLGSEIKHAVCTDTHAYIITQSNTMYKIRHVSTLEREGKHAFSSDHIHALTIYGQNELYIGYTGTSTGNHAVGRVDVSSLQVMDTVDIEFPDRVNAVLRGRDGMLYVATEGGSMYQFDEDLEVVAQADVSDHALTSMSWSYGDGTICVAGSGLFKVDPRDMSMRDFSHETAFRTQHLLYLEFEETERFDAISNWNPTYSWKQDRGTGIYHAAPGQIGISAHTHPIMMISEQGVNLTRDMRIQHALHVMNDCYVYRDVSVDGIIRINGAMKKGFNIQDIDADTVTRGTLAVERGGTGRNALDRHKLLVGDDLNGIQSPSALHWDAQKERLGIKTDAPAYTLDVNGNMRVEQELIWSSDQRLKEDIHPIRDALDKVLALQGTRFRRKYADKPKDQFGFIAQQVGECVPELVDIDETTGYMGVAYGNVTALLVEGMREMRAEIEALRKQVRELMR